MASIQRGINQLVGSIVEGTRSPALKHKEDVCSQSNLLNQRGKVVLTASEQKRISALQNAQRTIESISKQHRSVKERFDKIRKVIEDGK